MYFFEKGGTRTILSGRELNEKILNRFSKNNFQKCRNNFEKVRKNHIIYENEDIFSYFQLTENEIYSIINKYLSILMNLEEVFKRENRYALHLLNFCLFGLACLLCAEKMKICL